MFPDITWIYTFIYLSNITCGCWLLVKRLHSELIRKSDELLRKTNEFKCNNKELNQAPSCVLRENQELNQTLSRTRDEQERALLGQGSAETRARDFEHELLKRDEELQSAWDVVRKVQEDRGRSVRWSRALEAEVVELRRNISELRHAAELRAVADEYRI